jgi:hypothetical protein
MLYGREYICFSAGAGIFVIAVVYEKRALIKAD